MPYQRVFWEDRVLDVNNNVLVEGTPVNEINLNNSEEGTSAAAIELDVLTQHMLQNNRHLSDLAGEVGEVILTNTETYPFNNSFATVSFLIPRNTLNYRVLVEIVSSVGEVGEVIISAKQLNGMGIEFTGSGSSATIKYYIFGGVQQ